MRALSLVIIGLAMPVAAPATTLQRLTMDEMIQKSTSIVRAKVLGSHSAWRGPDIYTWYELEVLEGWKSGGTSKIEVAIPGGVEKGLRQVVAGAPSLNVGQEYVIFLWTSRSGLTQVIGLSQGLLSVKQTESGDAVLIRPAASDLMLDKNGHVVSDNTLMMQLSELRARIQRVLGVGK